ncbi:MAG TPA: YhbY family RNA-binding protein, partial [Bacillota bacterium]|nr:YhbY family RNA-binding protein [Bacillota bacterium]
MTLTGKQKRHLRGLAMTRRPVFQIGKDGITPALVQSLNDYLVKN